MVSTRKTLAGFTLIELLIALSIMMTVLTTSMYGYNLFMQNWQRRLSNIDTAFERYHKLHLLNSALRGITPYVMLEEERVGFYFLGRGEGFTAVTHTPIVNAEYPAVIRVFFEVQENNLLRLVYEEASLKDQLLLKVEQQLPFSHRFVMLTDLENINFRYFGVDASKQVINDMQPVPVWHDSFDGMRIYSQPQVIEVTLNEFRWPIALVERVQAAIARNVEGV